MSPDEPRTSGYDAEKVDLGRGTDSHEVNWLELFYDLVFAAAVVTFSDAISHHPDGEVIVVVTGAFVAVWLVWVATTAYVNAFGIDDAIHRVLVVVQMLLLTLCSLAVGDGVDRSPELAAGSFTLLVLDVAIMYGRYSHRGSPRAAFARLRRNQFALAAPPVLVGGFLATPARDVMWVLGIVAVAWPTLGIRRVTRVGAPPLDEGHLIDRLGLLTIIVLGESFVKVSLVVTDGHLDGIDVLVLVALFVVISAVWWAYFDDIPHAGIREGQSALTGWLLGHLVLQIALVGVAVAYAKWLHYSVTDNFSAERSLLGAGPVIAILLMLAVVGLCTRRVPHRDLTALRVGMALVVAVFAATRWQTLHFGVATESIALALIMGVHAALAAHLRRATTVPPVDSSSA